VPYSKGHSYVTPADINVNLHPSSALYSAMPKLIVALEFIQSTRTYAEQASVVRASWLKEYNIQLDMSDDSSRAGHKAYQEFGADRKKMRRFERSREALGYDEYSMPAKPEMSNGRRLFRPETARIQPEYRKPEPRQTRDRREAAPATAAEANNDLILAGRQLRVVSTSRRQSLVILTLDDLRALASLPELFINKAQAQFRTSVRDNTGKSEILHNYRLGEVVGVSKVLGLVDAQPIPDTIPLGASLSAQQNIKVLLRALPYLGLPCIAQRGKSGWLTLTCAEEIFWFEYNDDPQEALELSASALEVIDDYVRDTNMLKQINDAQERLVGKLRKIKQIVTDALDRK